MNVNISVLKRSEQRQRADRYSDVAYDVQLTVEPRAQAASDQDLVFALPEFRDASGSELYRVDSAHNFRAGQTSDSSASGRQPRLAALREGRREGGFYVYASEHQASDAQCIQELRGALTRAVLNVLPSN